MSNNTASSDNSPDEDKPQEPRRGGFNLGWIIFLLFAVGQPLLRFLRSIWSSAAPSGGFAISGDIIPWIVGGGVALFVLVAVLRAWSGTATSRTPGSPTTYGFPTQPTVPQPRPFGTSSNSAPGMPRGGPPTSLPGGKPRFEPIVEPWVLLVGIAGFVIFGGLALAFGLFS